MPQGIPGAYTIYVYLHNICTTVNRNAICLVRERQIGIFNNNDG